jgi:hypothetical protein
MQSAWVILADRGNVGWIWCVQAQRSVRAVPVVVLDVDAQGLLEMISSHDQQPVQALGPDGANPPLCVGVRRGCLYRCQDDLGALGADYVVEAAAELRVAVTQQEAHASSLLLQCEQQVAGLLGDPAARRGGGHAGQVDAAGVQLDGSTARTVVVARWCRR